MPRTIGRDEVKRFLDQGAQIVDVLPPEEYAHAHTAGAVNRPILDRMEREGWETCFVVTESRVDLGRLYRSDLRAGRGPTAGAAMRPGPSTYRPDLTAREMLARMREHDLKTAPVTTSDGRLVGLVRRADLERALAARSAASPVTAEGQRAAR